MEALLAVGKFLVDNHELVSAIQEAIEGGATHDEILASIKATMVAASDAVVEAELGPRP